MTYLSALRQQVKLGTDLMDSIKRDVRYYLHVAQQAYPGQYEVAAGLQVLCYAYQDTHTKACRQLDKAKATLAVMREGRAKQTDINRGSKLVRKLSAQITGTNRRIERVVDALRYREQNPGPDVPWFSRGSSVLREPFAGYSSGPLGGTFLGGAPAAPVVSVQPAVPAVPTEPTEPTVPAGPVTVVVGDIVSSDPPVFQELAGTAVTLSDKLVAAMAGWRGDADIANSINFINETFRAAKTSRAILFAPIGVRDGEYAFHTIANGINRVLEFGDSSGFGTDEDTVTILLKMMYHLNKPVRGQPLYKRLADAYAVLSRDNGVAMPLHYYDRGTFWDGSDACGRKHTYKMAEGNEFTGGYYYEVPRA